MTTEKEYDAFIASIDDTVAGVDDVGCGLAWHVDCAAITNANDMGTNDQAAMWETAYRTANMVADDWQSFFPQLVKN